MADLDKAIKNQEEICDFIRRIHFFRGSIDDEHLQTKADEVLELLKEQQPTIEQPKWIPVSERLPKKEDIPYDCLVTLEHGVVCEATFLDMDTPYHKWCANTGWLYHVTHWMPMPKPPKDGEQE